MGGMWGCRTGWLRRLVTLSRVETDVEGIVLLKLDRPEAKNAISGDLLASLEQRVRDVSQDRDVRCVLLRSAVDGIFCAGADLKERLQMSTEEAALTVARLRSCFDAFSRIPVPTIGVIEGGAFGGGAELALACDMRIGRLSLARAGGLNASIALPETRLGIIPGAGGTQRLPRLIGLSKAKELIFTGRRIDARTALEMGLLDHVAEDPMEHALQLAQEISGGGPVAVRLSKQAIDAGMQTNIANGLEIEGQCYNETLKTEDRLEGLRAFQEKRKPVYKGS